MSNPSSVPQPGAAQPSKSGKSKKLLILLGCGGVLLIFLVLGSIMLGLLLPALAKARNTAQRLKSATQLQYIRLLMEDDPQGMATILGNPAPNLEDGMSASAQWESPLTAVGGETSYLFLAPSIGAALPNGATTPLLIENPNLIDGPGLNVAYGDGHVVWEQRADAIKMLERHGSRVFQTNGRPWRRTSAEP
jgi:prepilin-type processing-associated H-X9-DG protein